MGAYEYVPAYGFQLFITATDMGIVLAWTSQPDGTYTVLSSADLLSGEWATEETIQSQTTATTWTDSDATSTRKFYRIGIE